MEKACRLSNTTQWDIAPSLPVPSLPVFCGALDQKLQLSEESAGAGSRSVDRTDIVNHASRIAEFLRDCDVSYLNLKQDVKPTVDGSGESPRLYNEVLKYNSEAFQLCIPGLVKEPNCNTSVPEKKFFKQNAREIGHADREFGGTFNDHFGTNVVNDLSASASLRKPKVKKKEIDSVHYSEGPDVPNHQAIIGSFTEIVEDFCGRAEIPPGDPDEGAEGPSLPLADIKTIVNEILSVRAKKVLHLVPLDTLIRLLNVLDHQIQCGQGFSMEENENSDADSVVSIICALESTYAALAIMTHGDMPKQLYKEEFIERIIDFSRHQITDSMSVCDPSYRALHKPIENGKFDVDEDEDDDADIGSTGKKRRNVRSFKLKKSTGNKVSAAVYAVIQKLCSILGFLKDLLSVEKLSDSCILQLVKTSFSTFLVDNIQLLQLKAIGLICGVFAAYPHHRNFLMDETLQLLRKLPFSKRALRTYHLPDEEQKQIQMITALLIQLIQCTANLPEIFQKQFTFSYLLDASIDASSPTKCLESATEACCLFWTSVLQRCTNAKSQDLSESKTILENLVLDLLTTLNLPEYPASASILEVLCVLLLQNAGLKSKDISARCMAVDLLGTVAARLKRDAVFCGRDRFWMSRELFDGNNGDNCDSDMKDICYVCLDRCLKQMIACHVCERCFHLDCIGVAGQEILFRDWSCHVCQCEKQLKVLQSYCKSQNKADNKKNMGATGSNNPTSNSVSTLEIIQQILLNYLQENGSADDAHLFTRWFYLCMWYKDDSLSKEKIIYYLARLKSKAVLRDSGSSLLLSRDWAKKICLALGQNNSFSRGFDTILSLLLASLRENSPVLRAKALRAVSAIVEADPEVLCDNRVQCAVEGRFCDSAISVREAALELVGRHIASHPDVGLKYFEKVAERIKDTGVSVRKRAIKIIRDLCMSNANFMETTKAFIEIISRVSDEESSIQDLVCKTFYEFWFEEPSGTQTQFMSDGSCVPVEVAKKTEQIVDMLRNMPNNQRLVSVIKRNLALDFFPQSNKATGVNNVSLASVRRRCELMCKCLLERILQVEETNNNEEEVRALPYVLALQAFCVVDPTLCSPATDPSQFVVTLQPYLKNQVNNREVAQMLESIIFVIDAVLPLLRKPPQSVVDELEQDLKHMIVRHSFLTVVHSCIKCLCSLGKSSGKGANLVDYLIQIFFKQLHGPVVDNKQLLGRSIFCLGLLIRYGSELMINCDNHPVHIVKGLSLLKKYLLLEDFGVKVRSLQALGFILIARPEYMLEMDIRKILEASLSSTADPRLKGQALQNLYEYLLDAENQLGRESVSCMETQFIENAGTSVPVAAGAGDTNICGGIIQLYWDNVLERCLDVNDQVRQSALKIVEVVLRQGLVHPITSVPYLVALETDPQEVNSKLAHHLLMNMNEKYPSFFESRLGDGLQMSFRFIQSTVGNHNTVSKNVKGKSDSTFACVRPGISRIYRLIRGNRNSRNKFMHSIVRKFEPGGWNSSSIPFLVYCTEILASLPFTCPDEPLYLIYDINRVVQLRAGPLESNMKTWSSFFQKDSINISNENCEGKMSEADHISSSIEPMTANMSPGDFYGISKENLQRYKADCHDAIALQLLLKLKRHLKIVYGLNDARCQAFSIKEHPKTGETLSRQSIPFNISDATISLPTSHKDMVEKYQDFKALLKEDTIDYSTYTASIKRRRPPPKSSRGGKPAHEAGEDDDEDDESWTGGPRKLSFSAQKSNTGTGGTGIAGTGRVTRQRLYLESLV